MILSINIKINHPVDPNISKTQNEPTINNGKDILSSISFVHDDLQRIVTYQITNDTAIAYEIHIIYILFRSIVKIEISRVIAKIKNTTEVIINI